MRVWLLSMLLAACSFDHGQVAPDGGTTAFGDADADGQVACVSFSSQFDTCALAPSDTDLTLTGAYRYDTDAGTLALDDASVPVTRMQLMGKAGLVEVVLVRDLRMTANSTLRATGALPLAFVAYGAITIEGSASIDVSAGGAGARAACDGGAIGGTPRDGGAGGGGGGGFAAAGGDGGNGDSDGSSPAPGGTGGVTAAATPLGPLGGCPGADGGEGADDCGERGEAGGAIYLAAAQRIELASGASISAGGGGGIGGDAEGGSFGDAGGGGGGSGGMILLESRIVHSLGVLAANGGGGGEASGDGDAGTSGMPGALGAAAAPGGAGNSPTGTDGGAGGALAAPGGLSVTTSDKGGGGGGGGGVGYIIVLSADPMIALASPDPI